MAHCAHWSWLSPIFKASSHLFEIETHFSVDVVLVVAIEENITYDFLLFTVIILIRSFLSIQKLVGRIWLDEIVLHSCIFEHHWLIRNSNQDSRKVIILITYYIQHLSQIGGCFQLHASKNAQFSFRFMSPCDHARLGFRFLVKTGEDIWNISD